MSPSESLFEIDGPIATFTFNRPDARNALTWGMYRALVDACDEVDRRQEVRAFVLRGAGAQAFAAGTDIAQFLEFHDAEDGLRYERQIDTVLDRLERVAVPTIAQVQGIAAAGGCAIALTCDVRIGTPEAKFGVPIARTLGNCLSAASSARLMALLGPAGLKDLLFTGRFIDGTEAQARGLMTRLVPAADLDRAVHDYAATVAANAPLTIRASKEIVRRLDALRRAVEGLDTDQIERCYGSNDFHEGVAAFLEKRAPRWTGI